MIADITAARDAALAEIETAATLDDITSMTTRFAGKKGELAGLKKRLGSLESIDEKKAAGAAINEAMDSPPQTTRARLRGEFIRRAKERKRDYTVDWVHLKLNDQAQRTVLCKDPFRSQDERVDRLIEAL